MHSFFERFQALGHRHHHRHAGHHHHRGFQGFGFDQAPGFPGDPGRHGGGLGPGRKLGSADLQLLILALLAQKPQHGYEIIKALGERSNGYYSPSPGMVYPALTYLDEIGHATVSAEGTKKLYCITPDGQAHLDENRQAADTLLQQLAWIGQKMNDMRRAFSGDASAESAAINASSTEAGFGRRGGHGRRGRVSFSAKVEPAYRALTSALLDRPANTELEQQRIAAILERATAEIRAGNGEPE